MKSFLTALRQDLRTLRWVLLPWLGIQVWWIFDGLSRFPASPVDLERVYSVYAVLFHLGWAAILTLLAFSHPPCDPLAAWRTRPIRGWIVGAEKVGVGLFLLVIIPTLCSLASDPFRDSLITPYFFPRWLVVLSGYTGAFILLFLMASFTRGIRQFFGVAVVLFVLGMLGLVNPVTEGTVIVLRNYFGVTALSLSVAIGILGYASLIIAQYGRPRVILNLVRAVTWLILIVTLLPWIFPNFQTPPSSLRAQDATASITAVTTQEHTIRVPSRHPVTADLSSSSSSTEPKKFEPTVPPAPSGVLLWENRIIRDLQLDITFEHLDPKYAWAFVGTKPRLALHLHPSQLYLNDALLHQLGVPGYLIEPGWRAAATTHARLHVRVRDEDLTATIDPDFPYPDQAVLVAVKLREIADLRLEPKIDLSAPSGLTVRISALVLSPESQFIAVEVSMPPPHVRDFVLNWGNSRKASVSRERVDRQPILVVIDDENQRAQILTYPKFSDDEFNRLMTRPYRHELRRLPDWNTPWENLRLKIFEVHYLGHLSLPLEPPSSRP